MQQLPELTPANVKALRLKAGLTQKQAGEIFATGLRGWQRREEDGTKSNVSLTVGEYHYLLLLAGEHPQYKLTLKHTCDLVPHTLP